LASLNGEVYFEATSPTIGSGIWRTDGTAEGTVRINPVQVSSDPFYSGQAARIGGLVYFVGSDTVHGDELWRTDGTDAGTFRLTDVRPGGGSGSGIGEITDVGGTAYLVGDDASNHRQIWRSDGTPEGTSLVFQLEQGQDKSISPDLLSYHGSLYFTGYTLGAGGELYTSDGTTAGTTVVRDVDPGTESSTAGRYTSVSGRTVFVSNDPDRLWVTDGIEAGTSPLSQDLSPTSALVSGGNVLYFGGRDAPHGEELWQTDGTPEGTRLVVDLAPGPQSSGPTSITVIGDSVYVSTRQGPTQFAAWRVDLDTGAATQLAGVTNNSTLLGSPSGFTAGGAHVFFVANNRATTGSELWKTDGTAAGTMLVRDIVPGTGSSSPSFLVAYDGRLYFTATGNGVGRELWSSNGTAAGTVLVKDI